MKIAVFLPPIYMEPFSSAIAAMHSPGDFMCLEYRELHEICTLYEMHREDICGILFSGSLSENYFHFCYPKVRIPVTCVRHNQALTALALLRFVQDHPDIPLSQVFCDGINHVTEIEIYEEYLGRGQMPHFLQTLHYTDTMMSELAEDIIAQYRCGKIRHGFFTISSLYESVAAAGCPCTHLSLRPESIRQGLGEIWQLTQSGQHTKDRVISAILDYSHKITGDYDEQEYREATLFKILVDHKRSLPDPAALTITRAGGQIELSMATLCDEETPYEALLPCLRYVYSQCAFDTAAGLGIGRRLPEARENALRALAYARDFGPSPIFGMEEHILTGPLLSGQCLVIRTDLLSVAARFASELNMTPLNYVRVLTLLRTRNTPVTSEEIASCLNVTVRSANRIIASLTAHKILEEATMPRGAQGKGRPSRFYQLSQRVQSPEQLTDKHP